MNIVLSDINYKLNLINIYEKVIIIIEKFKVT